MEETKKVISQEEIDDHYAVGYILSPDKDYWIRDYIDVICPVCGFIGGIPRVSECNIPRHCGCFEMIPLKKGWWKNVVEDAKKE